MTDEQLTDALESLAFGVVGMTAKALNQVGREKELTLTQWRVLVVLGAGPLRVGAIADRVGVALPSASRLVTRMEEHGFVQTARDEQDRRATLVSLAPLGVTTRDGVISRRRKLIGDLVADEPALLDVSFEGGLAILARRLARFE